MKRYEPTVFSKRMHTLDKRKRWFVLVPIDAIERSDSTMIVHIQNKEINLHHLASVDVIDEDTLEKLYDDLYQDGLP
jgi:hypothetical protein